VREKIGIFFGKKETTPGGKALKFYASVRVSVTKGEKITGKDNEQIGNWMKATMVKNKVGYPWRSAEFELFYERGVDLIGDAIDYGEKKGVVEKVGNTYEFNGEKLGAGRDKAKAYLEEHKETYEKIVEKIKSIGKGELPSGQEQPKKRKTKAED
jgi:recombination protein RecA